MKLDAPLFFPVVFRVLLFTVLLRIFRIAYVKNSGLFC